ncbi:MAG TPA: serine protease [Rhizomicrobium sp.]|nr:serine protease [Rhizomicrobium sp.]
MQNASAAAPDPFLAAIAGMKKSIAAVVCVRPHAPTERFAPLIDGTAFFTTASGEFLTAAHVARDFSTGGSLQNCPMGVWFSEGINAGHIDFQMFPVSRCVADNDVDLARCVTTTDLTTLKDVKLKPQPVAIDGSQRSDGTAIAVTGYPLSSLLPISSRGYIGAYATNPLGNTEIALDRAAWPGGSGSPVYDAQGKVVGLVSQAGEGAASGISFARASSSIVRFLATHPLPPPQSAPPAVLPPSSAPTQSPAPAPPTVTPTSPAAH